MTTTWETVVGLEIHVQLTARGRILRHVPCVSGYTARFR